MIARAGSEGRRALPIIPSYAGFITMRKSATRGATVATNPQSPHERESTLYWVSSQLPARPARTFASSFFCSGLTAIPNASHDDEQHTGHREPAIGLDDAIERLRSRAQIIGAIGMHFPENTRDDVSEEQHHALG